MPGQSSQITPRLYEALQLTFQLHGRDVRKASTVPYMAHLLSVCALVQQDGGDEDEAIAALLHDALEDKPDQISRAEIRARFGQHVLDIIECSVDTPSDYAGGPKPPWRERKEAYLAHVRGADPRLLRVSIADKIDNVRAMLADHHRVGDQLWKRFKAGRADQLWYYEGAVQAYEAAGYRGTLLDELRQLVAKLRQQTEGITRPPGREL
jgi:(p)ppGpp synthase/HD superfamily hydrolase